LNGSFDCYCVVLFVAIRGPLIRLPVLIYSDWFPFLLVLFVCPKKEEEKKLMPVVSKDILLLTCYILGSCILYTEIVHFSKWFLTITWPLKTIWSSSLLIDSMLMLNTYQYIIPVNFMKTIFNP